MRHLLSSATTTTSKKRIVVTLALLTGVAVAFWAFSRYPALFQEKERAEHGLLLDRLVGKITKEETVYIPPGRETWYDVPFEILKTSLEWVSANEIGMIFGIVFGGTLLSLALPFLATRKIFSLQGMQGSLVGTVVGSPLGICANCVAPVGLSMYRKGFSLETTLATMVASPTLNVVGLVILFSAFPPSLAVTKIAATAFIVFGAIPFIAKSFRGLQNPSPALRKQQFVLESWGRALLLSFASAGYHIFKLTLLVVPLMILAGIFGAALVTLFPLERFLEAGEYQYLFLPLAALVGTILPIPMLVDIILVKGLIESGLRFGPAAALLITMPAYSIFSAFILGKYVSRKLAAAIFLAVFLIGTAGGAALAALTGNEVIVGLPDPNGSFVQAIKGSGLSGASTYGGAAFGDYNSDGYLDILLPALPTQYQLFRNNGNGKFSNVTNESGIHGVVGANMAAFGDYNNDGCPDVYFSTKRGERASAEVPGARDILYRNNCDGTFTNVTEEAGVKELYDGFGVAWADYNNDGFLDLYVANWGFMKNASNWSLEPNVLYQNNGDGTFTNVTQEAGVEGREQCELIRPFPLFPRESRLWKNTQKPVTPIGWKLHWQPMWFDYNNDGFSDLYVAHDAGVSVLYKNNGDGTFTDTTEEAGLCHEGSGMGVAAGDYDNDGDLDLYVTHTGRNLLWRNNSDGTFTEVSEEVGVANFGFLGWGTEFFDYDNDGDLDLYVVNGSSENPMVKSRVKKKLDRLYRNDNGLFTQVAEREGLFGNDAKDAAAFGDYNNDGSVDVFIISMNTPDQIGRTSNRLYQNKPNHNSWLAIQLVGTKSNRDGVGAKIKVTAEGKTQFRQVISGSSFLSQNSLWQTFGLGTSAIADLTEIYWPSGTVQKLHRVRANQKILVTESAESN